MKAIFKNLFSTYKPHREEMNPVFISKYAKSGLTQQEGLEIKHLIKKAFEEDKIFKENTIGLNDLSSHIAKDRYKVSQVLNEYLGKNFYSILNYYRIKEAQEMLLSKPHLCVKSIMYEVGFNSKTSFYAAFKKETGLSPNDYRDLVMYAS